MDRATLARVDQRAAARSVKRRKELLYDLEPRTADQLPFLRLIHVIEEERYFRVRLAAALRYVGIDDDGRVESVRVRLMDGELARECWSKLQAPAAALLRRFQANCDLLDRSIWPPRRRLVEPPPCAPLCLSVLSVLHHSSQLRSGVEDDVARFDAAIFAVCSRSAVFDTETGGIMVASSKQRPAPHEA